MERVKEVGLWILKVLSYKMSNKIYYIYISNEYVNEMDDMYSF